MIASDVDFSAAELQPAMMEPSAVFDGIPDEANSALKRSG
jgi:hypothetical protein